MSIQLSVDLRSQFGEVRNQGQRPTCMAFAASDAHAFARGKMEMLSVEYAFFHAVRRKLVPDPTKGVPFSLMSTTIELDGQPLEQAWPYRSTPVAVDSWKPPKDPGELFRHASSTAALGINTICVSLDTRRPVMVIFDISHSFFHAGTSGIIGPANEPRINTHAVIAVGHGTSNGARYILVRNSWGPRWADQGYAWMHEQYLIPRLLVLGVMN